jgi:type IV pilus assembly protein PilY1
MKPRPVHAVHDTARKAGIKMNFNRFKWLLVLCLLLTRLPAFAEDVDLFAWANKNSQGSANVLFILDNAANFSASVTGQNCSISSAGVVVTDGTGTSPTNLDGKAGAVEQCALYSVIKSLSTSASVTLNIGVMVFNSNGQQTFNATNNTFSSFCPGGTGGCVIMPVTGLTPTVQTNMLDWIRNWAISGNSNYVMKANNSANGASMQEAWAYYMGKTGVSGKNYSGSAPTGGCGKNYVIFIGNDYRNNAGPGDGTNAANSPLMPLMGTGASNENANPVATAAERAVISDTITTQCGTSSLSSAEGDGIYALNWAKYMKDNAVAKTYAVGILGPTCNPIYAAHLTKLGSSEVGGGKFFGTNSYAELVAALNTALTEILSVNSVFSSVSLPVSVNTQGSYLDQVFVGMFRPDDTFSPRWNGNLKQYQLGFIGGALKLLDADRASAINSSTGFITECARSYWTPTSVDTYWDYLPNGTCAAIANSKISNYPDGNVVEKGAQAYTLRGIAPTARVVKTCGSTMGTCAGASDLKSFNTTNVTTTQLGTSSSTFQATLISWAQGTNVLNEGNKGTTVMRPSVHGDVVHSRPAPVNHGASDDTPQIVVYYGANDGMLRAINGDQTATFGGAAPGAELWAFMPPEFDSNVSRLYNNSPAIKFPLDNVTGATPKPYGMDGPISSLKATIGGSTKMFVYGTMRRGGRAVYAFDVTTPASPALKWKRGCASASLTDTDCGTGNNTMTDVGQTWSTAKFFYASNYSSGTSPLLIMGGGYDTCEDFDALSAGGANHNCVAASKGKKVYVLDADDGHVVRAFDTVAPSGGVARGVVGDVTIVPDANGKAIYGYVADLGGSVYRISFAGADSSAWTMTRIAFLGCGTASSSPSTVSSCTANRKFMFQPSVVSTDNITYYILLGSGDREKPVTYYSGSTAVTNYFFVIKDQPTTTSWLSDESANCSGASILCLNSLLALTSVTTPHSDSDLAGKKGWYLAFVSTEQVVTAAVTHFGIVTFSTHQPASTSTNSCSTNLGTTQVYNLSYLNGTGTVTNVAGGGLPPSAVVGVVKLTGANTSSGSGTELVPFCVGCTGDSSLEGSKLTGASSSTRATSRLYWYIQK